MDNVTHSLVGLAAGEAFYQTRKPNIALRPVFWLLSVFANNAPDLDVLLTSTLLPGPLHYLLHHRGHSHTLGALLPLAFLCWLVTLFIFRKQNIGVSEKISLFVCALVGVALHIFADFWNVYGVHPFWPLNSHWYYGDFIFIVEPWFWVLLLPVFFWLVQSKTLKVFFALLVVFILFLSWTLPLIPKPLALLLSLGALLSFASKYFSEKIRLRFILGTIALVLGSFFWLKQTATKLAQEYLPSANGFTVSDRILSPAAANPFCWNLIQIQSNGSSYEAVRAILAPWPRLISAPNCPLPAEGSAAFENTNLASTLPNDKILLAGTYRLDLQTLRTLSQDNCAVREYLQFARAPFLAQIEGTLVMGDLRFDREKALGFAEMPVKTECARWKVDWRPPFAEARGF